MTRAAAALLALGAALLASQLLRERPWQAGLCAGAALLIWGGLLVTDQRHRRARDIERRRRGRPGYIHRGGLR